MRKSKELSAIKIQQRRKKFNKEVIGKAVSITRKNGWTEMTFPDGQIFRCRGMIVDGGLIYEA